MLPYFPRRSNAAIAEGVAIRRGIGLIPPPTDQGAEKVALDCVGKYEYMPDGSWKGSGTCTDHYKGGKVYESFEEGSHLKEYTTKFTGGTGKYEGATGSGTYFYDQLTVTLAAGTYKNSIQLP